MEHKGRYCYAYPHAALTTDCVVFGYDGQELKVLLIRRGAEPYKGRWAFPGGFLRMDETLEQCARRELMEETSFCPAMLEQFHTYSDVNRDPRERVITVAYFALVKPAAVKGGDDAAEARWYEIHHVPPLAFDHDVILAEALRHLKEQVHFKPICFTLLGDAFTLPQLQHIYETILDTTFDRRNFQRKMIPILIPTEAPKPVSDSPASEALTPEELMDMYMQEEAPVPSRVCCCSSKMYREETPHTVNASVARAPRDTHIAFSVKAKELPEDDTPAGSKREAGRKPQWFRFNLLRYLQLKKESEDKLDI